MQFVNMEKILVVVEREKGERYNLTGEEEHGERDDCHREERGSRVGSPKRSTMPK